MTLVEIIQTKMSHNNRAKLLQLADCQRVEQATTASRGRDVDQHVQEQTGSTLERYGHFQLTGCIAHQPQVQVHIQMLLRCMLPKRNAR